MHMTMRLKMGVRSEQGSGMVTHQRLIALYKLHNFNGLLILIHFNGHLWQMRIKVFLSNGIVSKK